MKQVTILDRHGNPMRADVKKLAAEEAAPSAGTTRRPTFESVISGMTPEKMATVLNGAVADDPAEFFAMAMEMEERDTHYGAVLATRKRAVTKLDWQVEPVDDSPEEVKIAKALTEALKGRRFRKLRKSMMDALGKGVSVTEQTWNTDEQPWTPGQWVWRDQRFFDFDKDTRTRLLLRDGDDRRELTPGKYVVHQPDLKSGIPIRNGLARMVAWNFIMKNYTLKDWMAFCEIFGMPLRVGRYGRGASEEDKRRLLRAVLSIASDAGAIIPEGTNIEFIASAAGRGEAVFGALADYLDKQTSKAVLGQTMTTDDGSSLGQAKVHDEVRDDIRDDDAADCEETIERDVCIPFVVMNFGVRPAYPEFKLQIPEPEDIETLSNALSIFVPQGLKVKANQVRDKLGLDHPEDDDELLVAPATSQTPPPADDTSAVAALKLLQRSRFRAEDPNDDIDRIGEAELAQWEEIMTPIIEPFFDAAAAATDYDDFLDRIEPLFDAGTDRELIQSLARAMAKANINGLAGG
ncbi:MAG: DUF935 domain-containing protein [Pseudomonadota bacterium]